MKIIKNKNISVFVPDSGEILVLEISPGTWARDLIYACRLSDCYKFSKKDSGEVLCSDCDIFGAIEEGEKLIASRPVFAGSEIEKQVTVLIADRDKEYHDLKISPGTTVRDLRSHLSLDSIYVFSTETATEPFGDDEDLYYKVDNGQKLFASTRAEVGNRGDSGRAVSSVQRSKRPRSVARNPVGILIQRGWIKGWKDWRGYFETKSRKIRGRIEVHPNGDIDVYAKDPNPEALKRHSHRQCFRRHEDGWYWIHQYGGKRKTLEGAFLSAEQVLRDMESFRPGHSVGRKSPFGEFLRALGLS